MQRTVLESICGVLGSFLVIGCASSTPSSSAPGAVHPRAAACPRSDAAELAERTVEVGLRSWPHLSQEDNAVASPLTLLLLLGAMDVVSDGRTSRELEGLTAHGAGEWFRTLRDRGGRAEAAVFVPEDALSAVRSAARCARIDVLPTRPDAAETWLRRATPSASFQGTPSARRVVAAASFALSVAWYQPFLPSERTATFHDEDGRPIGEVPVFGGELGGGSYAETALVELVEVELASNEASELPPPSELSVLFALPRTGVTLSEVEQQLSPPLWRSWLSHLRSETVLLTIPRFRLRGASVSREALRALGVRSIDTPTLMEALGTDTSLAAIGASTELVVDEQGLSIWDSAAVEVVVRGDRHDVQLTRPFLVFVFDRSTGALLLIGRVVTPEVDGAPIERDTGAVTTPR